MLASYFVALRREGAAGPRPAWSRSPSRSPTGWCPDQGYAPSRWPARSPTTLGPWSGSNGGTQVVGGLALATGRVAEWAPADLAGSTGAQHDREAPVLEPQRREQRAEDQHQFLKNVSLLGGAAASRDTEGRPRASGVARPAGRRQGDRQDHRQGLRQARQEGGGADRRGTSDLAETALATGAALVGTVVASSRKAASRRPSIAGRRNAARKQACDERLGAGVEHARPDRQEGRAQQFKAESLAAERAQQAKARAAVRAKEDQNGGVGAKL